MDARLQLTDEQKQLVEQLREAYKKVYDAGVGIIQDHDNNDLYFFNTKNVCDWIWADDKPGKDQYEMFFDDLYHFYHGAIQCTGEDESLLILFND